MSVVAALDRLLALHDEAGSPLSRYARPGASRRDVERRLAGLGLGVPPELAELWGHRDGIDEDAWRREGAGAWRPILDDDGLRFADSASAVADCRLLRDTADYVASRPWWETGPEELWRRAWLPVFPIDPGRAVAVDCDPGSPGFGSAWSVDLEGTDAHEAAASVEELFVAVADRFEAAGSRWDAGERLLVSDAPA